MKILITGLAGFIGHHLCQHIIKNTDWEIIGLDKLNYSCKGLQRLKDMKYLNNDRIKIFTWDLINELSEGLIKELGDIDIIVHMAAETHVDNSIKNPTFVMKNNINSTITMLEYARQLKSLKQFIYFSTDEVFGALKFDDDKLYKENDPHKPTNPYSGSKSASEMLCMAYHNTYDVPIMIVNVMNAIGEREHVEKFVPLVMRKILNGETVNIHADLNGRPGTRFYIHARNIAAAVLFVLKNGNIGEKYNITGEKEVDNLEMAQKIAKYMNMELKYNIVYCGDFRKGHDLRYGLDGNKLFNLGWSLPVSFEDSLRKTIEWTIKEENLKWLDD
jgi:dTDP-glucose 4,6-dehydratase